jgi:hypothetical protein
VGFQAFTVAGVSDVAVQGLNVVPIRVEEVSRVVTRSVWNRQAALASHRPPSSRGGEATQLGEPKKESRKQHLKRAVLSPTALDNGQRSPRRLLAAVVRRMLYALRWSR